MPYYYSDKKLEDKFSALPDVEIIFGQFAECPKCTSGQFLGELDQECDSCVCEGNIVQATGEKGYFYAFGLPGCLWDSSPIGPFESEEEALEEAREFAGFGGEKEF